jgi:hypothetical protein
LRICLRENKSQGWVADFLATQHFSIYVGLRWSYNPPTTLFFKKIQVNRDYFVIFVKRKLISAGIVLVMLGWSAVGVAGVAHYLPGVFNTRDFFVPEKVGVYTALYLGNYSTNTLKDNKGSNINNATFVGPAGNTLTANLNTKIDLNIISPVIMWNPGYKILGADYAMYISIPFTSTSVGAALDAFTNINLEEQASFRGTSISGSNSTIGLNDIYVLKFPKNSSGHHA